ncbi:DNA-3-methyladenine glycosylase I [Sphingomonas sp. YR710]|jgi:DNA-3-methyladenine glycosylase I|uniref:DNA-3-methyladenine glycosylase I n=1 Tax=Sphingomonas sp. YR710 TaxID=1882773 RepID=UPI000884BBEA|nr:DNA-3-methyladenine glycosylase I [Sphingomonas sp. YR710]SDC58194.1 DNA-3-methyladenine glycosylase I [Sphingomonas sp. YR710]
MSGRCGWAGSDPLYVAYHDEEWGVPEWDSRALWEKLMLDGFQAGLAWITILRKRDAFRTAFAGFQPERITRFGESDIARLMADPGIVRSRAKIEAVVGNARAYLDMRDKGEDFAGTIWSISGGIPIVNHWKTLAEVPTQTPLSVEICKVLKARGFKFVGPTIVYAWMQACGIVNDHVTTCYRHSQLGEGPR